MKKQIYASLIGLKPEFRERYIVLHRHTFPQVLQRIHASHITDYSIFLKDDLLFSRMVHEGGEYKADMAAMADDPVTQEWWKLTDPMQQPLPERREGEWWAALTPLCSGHSPGWRPGADSIRCAFTAPAHLTLPGDAPLAVEAPGSWELYKGANACYLYLEAQQAKAMTGLLALLTARLGLAESMAEMEEVFHTTAPGYPAALPKKVFVTGCFDMLHSGHVAFLNEAAQFGDLYVCIGSDANVHHLKGRYPVNSQDERKYMIDALASVHECRINSGWGIMDFEKELRDILPDIFLVNEDGHTPAKQALCREMGIEYKVLRRIPHANLPVRSTTALRTECTIPFRIDIAGGWLDQPFVSKHHPGAVLTISIEPTVEFNERSGMASSTRRKAIELWGNEIPHGSYEQLARILFSFENPPGTREVAGSQDALGIVFPGLNRHDYDNHYWPARITSIDDEGILTWLEKNLYLVTLGPRVSSYDVLSGTRIDREGAKELAEAADECWQAILTRDLAAFGAAVRRSFEAQVAMFPNMVDEAVRATIMQYRDQAIGWKLSGAGGGGYLTMVARQPIAGAMQIKIRRKNTL